MSLISFIYRHTAFCRYDDNHITHYFSYKDFDGLQAEKVSFVTSNGFEVTGYLYNYDSYRKDDLVIFCHGIGGGHRSYMREIEYLCKNGYQVLSYDDTECWESEGKDMVGACQSIVCLEACLSFVKTREDLRDRRISVIGHSLGGFAAGNISSFTDVRLHSICIISGPCSLQSLLTKSFGGKIAFLAKPVLRYERRIFSERADSSSTVSLAKAVSEGTRVLVIHSDDDRTVSIDGGLEEVRQALGEQDGISYLRCTSKNHNPNYTEDAVSYMGQVFSEYADLCKKKVLKSISDKQKFMDGKDWMRMTEQDRNVWDVILANLC